MSTPQRRDGPGLIDQLIEDPYRFEFFQAVRLLERVLVARHGRGADLLPSQLRFRNASSLAFPPSEIGALDVRWRAGAEEPAGVERHIAAVEITPTFMGLLGVSGTLPLAYTEQIAQRELYHKDYAARAFLDVFTHRMLSLFYQAWKKSRLELEYETDRCHRYAPMVLALAGLGHAGLRDRLQPAAGGVDDHGLAFFAGALQKRTLSAIQLQQLLKAYLKVPVRIEQFCGRWYTLPVEARTALRGTGAALGRSALVGERVWQRDLRLRITLGPLDHRMFRRFLPGAPGVTALREILTLLTGASLDYEVLLVLCADAVHGGSLGTDTSGSGCRLGWDSYLQTQPSAADRADVRYDLHTAAA